MSLYAALGPILFEVLTSPETFKLTGEYTYAEHNIVEAPPLLQWLANDLRRVSLDLGFHVAFCNPTLQMILLQAAANAHFAYPLVMGNGIFRGFFVIESLEETQHYMAANGDYIAVSARLELREWILGADALASAITTSLANSVTPAPGIVAAPSPSTPPLGAGQPAAFDSNQPVSATNLLPSSAIVNLSNLGVPPGVTYSRAVYSQPGVSALVGVGPAGMTLGNPDSVPVSQIVRAG